jgi:flagellar biosynthesis/type III secretory pathway chaperone
MTSSAANSLGVLAPGAETAVLARPLAQLSESLMALQLTARELEPVLREKQRALVGNRLDLIELLVQREGELSARLNHQEYERQVRAVELAQELELDVDGICLSDLLDAASNLADTTPGSAEVEQVRRLSSELVEQLRRLEQVNSDNGYLSNNLMEYTQFLLQLVHNGTAQPGYCSNGKVAQAAAGHDLLDYRV